MFERFQLQSGLGKPPVILADRKEMFTCSVCNRPGWGPPNQRVHSGRCKEQHLREISARSAQRRRLKRARQQEIAACSA